MDNNIDYSNTKIFENHTKQSDTKQGNAQLKELYEAFYKSICKKANEETAGFEAEKYNAIQLLTCFDSYMTADKKIMILGQEANTDEGNVFVPSPHYQTDEYYKYEYKIAHVGEPGIPKKKCRHTEYLKTRELICGFDKTAASVDREESILSVLSNNLTAILRKSLNVKLKNINNLKTEMILSTRILFGTALTGIFIFTS